MKDSIFLVVAASVVAVLAWGFWHNLGTDGFALLNTIALVALAGDNFRLRRQLKRQP